MCREDQSPETKLREDMFLDDYRVLCERYGVVVDGCGYDFKLRLRVAYDSPGCNVDSYVDALRGTL